MNNSLRSSYVLSRTDTSTETKGVRLEIFLEDAILIQPSLWVKAFWIRKDYRVPAYGPSSAR